MAGPRIPRIETLIISIFFIAVGIWAIEKCSSKRADVVKRVQEFAASDEDKPERPATKETTLPKPDNKPAPAPTTEPSAPVAEEAAPSTTPTPAKSAGVPKLKQVSEGAATASTPAATSAAPTARTPAATSDGTTLYVTIDGLKMRKEPGLKGDLVAKLKLNEPVTFLNKKTEWTQEISLGYEKVTDHWVKIRTKSGKEGWVFGAGLHYFKMKRGGVMDK
ncbi:MAG: SH3 domain-containing protein [Lewinellaceae bacterium]|nr:SH3 domain-containing protein [Lewinellaceae bacterium]